MKLNISKTKVVTFSRKTNILTTFIKYVVLLYPVGIASDTFGYSCISTHS